MEVDSQMWLELGDLDSFWPMGLMVCKVISGDFVQAAPPPTTTREVADNCSSRGGVLHPARFRQVSLRKRHFPSVPCRLSAVSSVDGKACMSTYFRPHHPPAPAAAGQLHSLCRELSRSWLCPCFPAGLGIASNLSSAFPLQMVTTTHSSPGWLRLPPARMLRHLRR